MKKREGFTLIELMIVIAIIAIIAAIAIPSLLRGRVAANEISATGGLKQMVSHESIWQRDDSDRNTLKDYWTDDVAAFHYLQDSTGKKKEFIDIRFAGSCLNIATWVAGAVQTSKSGYFFAACTSDDIGVLNTTFLTVDGTALGAALDPDGAGPHPGGLARLNGSRFAFTAYPETFNGTGVRTFVVNQAGVVYAKDQGGVSQPIYPGPDPKTGGWGVSD